jgi:hypothetical protein
MHKLITTRKRNKDLLHCITAKKEKEKETRIHVGFYIAEKENDATFNSD